jgi:hypothetical protein
MQWSGLRTAGTASWHLKERRITFYFFADNYKKNE